MKWHNYAFVSLPVTGQTLAQNLENVPSLTEGQVFVMLLVISLDSTACFFLIMMVVSYTGF